MNVQLDTCSRLRAFGGELRLFSYAEFGRTDGPAEAVAHDELEDLCR